MPTRAEPPLGPTRPAFAAIFASFAPSSAFRARYPYPNPAPSLRRAPPRS